MASRTSTAGSIVTFTKKAPVLVLTHKQCFPYDPSSLESKFFSLPLELRQQIYRYCFYTPNVAFTKKVKGWYETPSSSDIIYGINNTALLAVSHRVRAEALPVLYGESNFRLADFDMLRSFLNCAIPSSDGAYLHIKRTSIMPWRRIFDRGTPNRWGESERGEWIIEALADLPNLREVELSDQHLPQQKEVYSKSEWFTLMETLRGNDGVLRVTHACMTDAWWVDWRLLGGRNFGWGEPILAKTSKTLRTWDEVVEFDGGNYPWHEVVAAAMELNWTQGPLRRIAVEHKNEPFTVLLWGLPENLRVSMTRQTLRKDAKKAQMELRAEIRKRTEKGRVAAPIGDASDDEYDRPVQAVIIGTRTRKIVTKEDARAARRHPRQTTAVWRERPRILATGITG